MGSPGDAGSWAAEVERDESDEGGRDVIAERIEGVVVSSTMLPSPLLEVLRDSEEKIQIRRALVEH